METLLLEAGPGAVEVAGVEVAAFGVIGCNTGYTAGLSIVIEANTAARDAASKSMGMNSGFFFATVAIMTWRCSRERTVTVALRFA